MEEMEERLFLPVKFQNKILTNPGFYGIVDGRMEELGLFFMLKSMRRSLKKFEFKWRWKSCAQESHWHVQNANSVTTT